MVFVLVLLAIWLHFILYVQYVPEKKYHMFLYIYIYFKISSIFYCKEYDGPRTEMQMAVEMTGRQRRDYAQWKSQQELADNDRMRRAHTEGGQWRREWDVEKQYVLVVLGKIID